MRPITAGATLALMLALTACARTGGLDEAVSRFRAADYAGAQKLAASEVQQSPSDKKALALLGWTYLKQGDPASAAKQLDRLKAIDPDYVEGTQLEAWIAYSRGDISASEAAFRKESHWADDLRGRSYYPGAFSNKDVVFIENIAADADNGLGLIAASRGDDQSAVGHFANAAKATDYPGRRDALWALAYAQARLDRPEQALATLRNIDDGRGSLENSVFYQVMLVRAGQAGQALALSAESAGAAPRMAAYPAVMALALASLGRTHEATSAMRMALKLSPAPLDAGVVSRMPPGVRAWAADLGGRLFARGDYRQARFLLAETAGKDACANRSMVAWSDHYAGAEKLAATEFDALANGDCPGVEDALLGQAISRLGLGELSGAEALLTRSLRMAPDNLRAQVARGAIAYLGGDYAQAIRIYSAHLGDLPRPGPVWSWGDSALNNLAWSYYSLADYHNASRMFRRLAANGGVQREAAALAGLGWVDLQQGHSADAADQFANAVMLAPTLAVARSGLDAVAKAR